MNSKQTKPIEKQAPKKTEFVRVDLRDESSQPPQRPTAKYSTCNN